MTQDFYLRLLEFGEKRPNGFSLDDILEDKELKLEDWEKNIARIHCENAFDNTKQYGGGFPNHETLFILVQGKGSGDFNEKKLKFIINLDSRFKYIDYIELKEARENARSARKFSWIAIILSILSMITAVLIPLLINQTVELDVNQLDSIINTIGTIDNKK